MIETLAKTGKKALTATVVGTTIAWATGVAAFVPMMAGAATLTDGDLIKASGAAVYYYRGADGKRCPFPNDKVFYSWFSDFKSVKTITDGELQAIGLCKTPMTYRTGTRLVKITTDPKVYAIEVPNMLRHVADEATAKALFGDNWNKQIDDVGDVFFGNYDASEKQVTTATPPAGFVFKASDTSKLYYIDKDTAGVYSKREISDLTAFKANGWKETYIRSVAPTVLAGLTAGTAIAAVEKGLSMPQFAAAAPVADKPADKPAEVAGALTVSLAGPASSVLIVGQALANLANLTFTGNGKVTGLTLKRTGVSADTTLSNVYLFDGAKRLTDAATVTTGGVINFTAADGLFTVLGSSVISVKSDLAGTSGETVGVDLTAVTMSSGEVKGVPLSGSTHSVALATLAAVALGAATASGNTDPAQGIKVWESQATVSTRDVNFTRVALRQIGSINAADISNFVLYVDGTEASKVASLDSNGYVTFTLDKKLTSGVRTLKVLADVTGGSGRTVQMSLRGAYDITLTDSQYSANLTATTAGGFPLHAAAWTVNAGTMTVIKATDSPSQNITVGASDIPIAKYTFTANGEKVKVETLRLGMLVTTTGNANTVTLRNVRILVNGAQVGSTTNVPAEAAFAAASGTSFTTNFYVTPGTPATVEVRSDVFDTTDAGGNTVNEIASGVVTTLQAVLVGGAGTSNAIPSVSLGTINVPSQANVLGTSLPISSGSLGLALTSNYAAQTVVVPQNAYKLASFTLAGNSTEAVNINTLELDFVSADGSDADATASFDASDDLTDLYIKYGDKVTSVKATVTDTDDTWSTSFTLAKNESKTFEVYANIGSTISATDSIRADFTITGVTADSGVTVYADSNNAGANTTVKDAGFVGQVITAGVGSLTATVDASRPNATLLDDAGTVQTAAYKFDAVNDNYTITDLTFTLANASAVKNVILRDGTTVVLSKSANTTVVFNGLTIAVAANTPKVLSVDLEMGSVGVGAGSTGSSVLTTLTSMTSRTSQGASATTAYALASQAMYAYKSVPTITNVALPTSVLVGGTQTVSKFTLATGSTGTVGWAKLAFTITKSANVNAITGATLWDVTSAPVQVSGTALIPAGTLGANGAQSGVLTFVPNTEQQVSGAKTYELRATFVAAPVAGDSVTVQIAQPSMFAASVGAYANTANYTDADASGTVTAGDTRRTGQTSVTSAYGQVNTGVATFVAAGDGVDENRSFGAVTTGQTIILTETGAATNVIGAITGTLVTTGLYACTAMDAANGSGSATTVIASILSISCTLGTTNQVVLNTLALAADPAAAVTTITLTSAAFALGSVVGANDSDLGVTLTRGVISALTPNNYYAAGATIAALTDVRQTAQLDVTSAYAVSGTTGVVVALAEATDEVLSFGTVTTGQTIILTEVGGAATANIAAITTGTLITTGGYVCTAMDGANGTGAATLVIASILSVLCTNGPANQVVLNLTPVADVVNQTQATTITLTSLTYAVGSIPTANDSDLGLAVTGGVLPAASFAWSDLSASSHGFTTADWTNGLLVKNLPTDTQNLSK